VATRLAESALKYQRAAHADNTHDAYGTAGRRYLAFGIKAGYQRLFPATDKLLCQFASMLADEGLAFKTIKVYLFGIRTIQLKQGMPFEDMRQRYLLYMTLQGIRKMIGDASKRKMPITVELLRLFAGLVRLLREVLGQRVKWGSIWAAILLGFFAMLRKDNLTKGKSKAFNDMQGLTRDDIQFVEATAGKPAVMWVRIRYSKTNQTRKPPVIIPVAATGDELCPVEAVRSHMRETQGTGETNLFLVKGKGSKFVPLTHVNLVAGIKELATAAGVDPKQYSGHSLRRGGATMAFQMGLSTHLIKNHGVWKGDSVYLYHELSAKDRLRLPMLMAQATARKSVMSY
jgi:integrase